ncbi:MAG: hypothetical protein IH808_08665 [Proteobacteria bacterium]|nr:hypothetical protein [Pseudomonadota bacterium]
MAKVTKEKKPVPDGLEFKYYDFQITLQEPQLGTVPKNPEVYQMFIESLKPEDQQDEEHKTVESREGRGWTGFHRDENGPFVYNYMIKGFLKAAGLVLREHIGIAALKSKVTNYVFVKPRRMHFDMTNAMQDQELLAYVGTGEATAKLGENGLVVLERPIQVQTAQGPRVSVIRSDVIGSGAALRCVLQVLKGPITEKVLKNLIDYGVLQGLGQWRSAGWGAFDASFEECDASKIDEYNPKYVATAAD